MYIIKMKKEILYAKTSEGLDLPVIDVTHPAFKLELTEAEQKANVAKFLAEDERWARLPRFLRTVLMRLALRNSSLGKGILAAQGSFLGAIETYLLKLGSENLGPWAKPIDRRIAASLPVIAVRLRLQDMARLMADSFLPALRASADRPLRFVNLAGGTAIDSLNALLILQKEAPGLLARPIAIDVLDRESIGPEFGKRLLRALQAEGAPLESLTITFRHTLWDWRSDGAILSAAVSAARAANALVIASSEGGLFEYGGDAEIVDALARLRGGGVVGVVGSVTRADEPIRRLHRYRGAATHPRGLDVFRKLIAPTGWTVNQVIERPFSDHVILSPQGTLPQVPGGAA
jgi:hypothetical protein